MAGRVLASPVRSPGTQRREERIVVGDTVRVGGGRLAGGPARPLVRREPIRQLGDAVLTARPQVGEEPAGLTASGAATSLTLGRPRDREVPAGTRDADIQEPSLLGEEVVVVECLADRQQALLDGRQRDGVPLEALGAMVREQVDALGRARALRRAPTVEFREIAVRVHPRVLAGLRAEDVQQGVQRGRPFARLLTGVTRHDIVVIAELGRPQRTDHPRAGRARWR